MMLRSSSTPVLGSLLASFSDSPNNNINNQHLSSELHAHRNCNTSSSKISCTNGRSKLPLTACEPKGTRAVYQGGGFRRTQSEGNLGELADEFKKSSERKANCCSLEAIPSFSDHYRKGIGSDDNDSDEDEGETQELELENVAYHPFEVPENQQQQGGRMYLATGLGVSGMSSNLVDVGGDNSNGRGINYRPVTYDRDGSDHNRHLMMEEHYRRMLEGDPGPGEPMLLRNYAQFLYQEKGDLERAEEYYSRAILADPKDGEILSQYAKLTWELHRDEKRAASYFERAIQASAQDSHVHAAYASFLWDTEEDEEIEQGTAAENTRNMQPLVHPGFIASATA